jgi:hypothetical protein
MRWSRCALIILCLGFSTVVWGQTAPPSPDPESVWKGLWQPAMDPAKSAQVQKLELVRDRIHIVLTDGTIQFTQPVNGIVFGAIFHGNGYLKVIPPNARETQQLMLFTKSPILSTTFSEATFSFSDGTFDEIARQVKWASSGPAGDDLYAKRQQQREDLGEALVPRVFKSILSADRPAGALFLADVKTEHGWVEAHFDNASPEQVVVGRWVDVGVVKTFDIWMSFPAGGSDPSQAFQDPAAKADFLIPTYHIDAAVTGGAELSATTRAEIHPRVPGERILLFNLDSNLRIESIKDSQGAALTFYQARETKDRYQSYGDYVAVILPRPTQAGQTVALDFRYAGKRVVRKVGVGNFFCQSFGWYPTLLSSDTGVEDFSLRSNFEINFRSPKKFSLVATGHKVSETKDGDLLVTSWKSEAPLAVAGFAFGDYKVLEQKEGDVNIQIYANRQPDDFMSSIQLAFDNPLPGTGPGTLGGGTPLGAVGELTPAAMAKTMGIEMANTLRVFQQYFGPYPYKELAVTNIPYSYGQGWPGLIYLSALSFLDSTQRNALGIKAHVELTDFFRAHESSHQWWGHRVAWKSYHDQWMSEGFAEFSGNLYTEFRENIKEYFRLLRDDKAALKNTDINGHHYEQVGPIWMGHRLRSSVSPRAYDTVIYKKGGYVLHMLRMMLYDFRNPDHDHLFKDMMKDFTQTYDNKAASTEDFKTIVEKHMSRNMDLDGNHRMDWFFNQYVYGTGIPQYEFQYSTEATADGKTKVSITITRNGVPDTWKDMVPLYVHQGQGMIRLGFANATQPVTKFDFIMPSRPEKLTVNDFEDLLADIKQ